MAHSSLLLDVQALTARYPSVTALEDVSFSIPRGEIVGLMGGSGSGISTLLHLLAGPIRGCAVDAGRILWHGHDIARMPPTQRSALGIRLVPQHPTFPDALTVAEAMWLGQEPVRFHCLLDHPAMARQSRTWLDRLGIPLDPATPVRLLTPAQRQILAWARALAADPQLLLLDHPTSCLRPRDTDPLFESLGDLQARGTAIVFASDRLEEIKALASRLLILRDGRLAGELDMPSANPLAVHRLLAGHSLDLPIKELIEPGIDRLRVSRLRTRRFPEIEVNFTIQEGEIVGMAGLVGAGRTAILRALFGLDPRLEGSVMINEAELPPGRPDVALGAGAMFLEGQASPDPCPGMTLRDSLCLASLPRLSAAGIISETAANRLARLLNHHLDITEQPLQSPLATLSPSQRRKAAIASQLALQPSVALFTAPTRGVTIAARAEIYECLERLAERGAAVLFASNDTNELLRLSDRLLVFRHGALAGTLSRQDDFTERGILRLAAP
ncbi:MAG: ATP-binding cassette domain-containing protein [Verrucomicrobiales bacterium]